MIAVEVEIARRALEENICKNEDHQRSLEYLMLYFQNLPESRFSRKSRGTWHLNLSSQWFELERLYKQPPPPDKV